MGSSSELNGSMHNDTGIWNGTGPELELESQRWSRVESSRVLGQTRLDRLGCRCCCQSSYSSVFDIGDGFSVLVVFWSGPGPPWQGKWVMGDGRWENGRWCLFNVLKFKLNTRKIRIWMEVFFLSRQFEFSSRDEMMKLNWIEMPSCPSLGANKIQRSTRLVLFIFFSLTFLSSLSYMIISLSNLPNDFAFFPS